MTDIGYVTWPQGWDGFEPMLRELIESRSLRRICEVGGGANPALPLDYVVAHGLEYTLLDISAAELAKAPEGYHRLVADICDERLPHDGGFDLIFSKMVAEHVSSGEVFHRNVHRLLAPGGIAFHFFPTLWAFPFVANRLSPEWLSSVVLNLTAPRDRFRDGKFPAYYSWCTGPTKRQMDRLRAVGYRIVAYRGVFGHGYYRNLPGVRELAHLYAGFLARHPAPRLTSYAYLVMEKS